MKNKKQKIIALSISLLVVLIVLVVNIGISFAYKDNYLKNRKIDGLSFENASIEYKNGISTFSVDIYNENNKSYELSNITFKFKDNNGKITTLVEDNLEPFESTEGRKIIKTTNNDLTNSVSLEYVINK